MEIFYKPKGPFFNDTHTHVHPLHTASIFPHNPVGPALDLIPLPSPARPPQSTMVAQLQSVSAARQAILEMLETVSTSPTFTGASLDHDSMSLLVCEREGEGRAAQSRVVVEMKVVGKMTNQLGNMHGEFGGWAGGREGGKEQSTEGSGKRGTGRRLVISRQGRWMMLRA